VVSVAGGERACLPEIGYGGRLVRSERLKVGVALRLATVVTVGSRYLRDQLAPTPTRLLPLGVDCSLFYPPARPLSSDPPRLVQAASLVPVKDQATLLRAAALLQTRRVDFALEIAGAGPLEPDVCRLVEQLGIGARVSFRGALTHDELPGFYRDAAAFVLSSRHEAQCMAALEAAACGVPIVGTAVGVVPELVPDAAVAVPIGDHGALAAALEALLRDAARRRALADAAVAQVSAEFAVETCVERTRALYRELVRGQGLLLQ
jgi:glycosyltransferase involved in cell wall biosynthesis